jgi:UDP-glucose 4-epimerase
MRILITGVAGFIGSNLAKRLLDEGHYVIGVDNLSHGSERNMEWFRDSKKFTWYKEDFGSFYILQDIDIVVHLASQKIPRYTSSFNTISANSDMIKNAVYIAMENKAKLVFASTSDVYGKNPRLPFNEDSDLVLGRTDVKRWAYAVSKIHSEHYIIGCHEEFGLEYTIMRFFSSYGINQNPTWWGGPQGLFIQNILEGKPIEIHGSGKQTRCFTYIDDTVDGIMKCIFSEKAKNEVFNIGNPATSVSICYLAQTIWELMGNSGTVPMTFIPYASFGKYEDVLERTPYIAKARKLLNFHPYFGLVEGLQKTIEWQTRLYHDNTI